MCSLCQRKSNRVKGHPFHVVSATPVDMFPHTPHCELVMLLERVKEGGVTGGERVKEKLAAKEGVLRVKEELGTRVERVKEELVSVKEVTGVERVVKEELEEVKEKVTGVERVKKELVTEENGASL